MKQIIVSLILALAALPMTLGRSNSEGLMNANERLILKRPTSREMTAVLIFKELTLW
jgi:hypothetical protein